MNKVILMGRLTKDPELRYTSNNTAVCTFTLAVDRRFSRQGEERKADFIQIVTWRHNAEFVSKYFSKGRMIAVSGSIQTRSWDGQDGQRRYATEVVADETYFADSKRDNTNSTYSEPARQEDAYNAEGFMPIEADDDLPF